MCAHHWRIAICSRMTVKRLRLFSMCIDSANPFSDCLCHGKSKNQLHCGLPSWPGDEVDQQRKLTLLQSEHGANTGGQMPILAFTAGQPLQLTTWLAGWQSVDLRARVSRRIAM